VSVPSQSALKREVGVLGLTSITVGGIIGSGIFALAATMGSVAGPAAVAALVFLGIVVILLALPYAELGAAFPLTGGPYSLPRKALGDFGGFLMGWGYFLYAFIGTAAIIDVFIEYLGTYIKGLTTISTAGVLGISYLGVGLALVLLVVFTLINIAGIKWGSWFAISTTIAKIIPLLLFGVIGLLYLRVGNFTAFGFTPFGWTSVAFAMSLGFFAFTGFEAASIPAEETKNPGRTIPLATILAVAIVCAVYALVAIAFIGGIHWAALGIAPGNWGGTGALLLNNLADGWGLAILGTVVVAGALISTFGASGDWVLLQGRMPYAMAKDGLFFKSLAKVSPRFGTPAVALIFASVLTGVILVVLPSFPEVALVASITTLVPYAAAALALMVLRRTEPTAPRPFRLPAAWILTPAAFISATVLIYWASWPWTLVGVFLTLVGVPLYFLFTSPTFRRVGHQIEIGLAVGLLAVVGLLMVYVFPAGTPIGGVPAWPLFGTALLFVGIPVYFVTMLFRRSTYQESKAVLWIVAYLGGLGLISYLGDQFFIYENFLTPPTYPITIQPTGTLATPYDLVVLVVFALVMFLWGYFSALRQGRPSPGAVELPATTTIPDARA
jgi:basic amino acid/polyamine antiporter, APA family